MEVESMRLGFSVLALHALGPVRSRKRLVADSQGLV